MLPAGRIVDRYEVLGLLGEGGMAVVYRVRHTALGSEHALKVLSAAAPAVRDRLLAEGRVQAGLDHPHALTVTDVIDVDGAPGLVMELVGGGTLEDWVLEDHPRAARIRVFRQILSAVEAAHSRGWVHRDLKPVNVLMKGHGPDALPKVADFGLVKAVDGRPGAGGKRTRDGVAMGTPGYMAPEQIADAATVDARADVYSLGCILVFMLTGEPAFEGEMLDVFAKVAAGHHRGLAPSDALHGLVERCLARDPGVRPSDATALGEALDAVGRRAEGEPAAPTVAAPTLAGVAVDLARERPVLPALFGVGGLVGVGVLGCLCGSGFLAVVLPGRSGPAVAEVGPPAVLEGLVGSCAASAERERLGYALVPRAPARLDEVLTLVEPADVRPRPREEGVLCTLPAGVRVVVREVPRPPRGDPARMWLAIYADGLLP